MTALPVTADDIVWSLNRMAQPDVTRGRVTAIRTFYEYQTAVAVDDKTVLMPLKFPSATALGWLGVDYYKMYPKALESVSQDDFNCCFKNTFGSGPWKFRSWKKGDSYEYDRNDDYFKDPMPYADGMKVFIITDYARRLATLKDPAGYGTVRHRGHPAGGRGAGAAGDRRQDAGSEGQRQRCLRFLVPLEPAAAG